MTIRIDNQVTIRHIQEIFSGMFPFLKIEFFKSPHNTYRHSVRGDMRLPSERAWQAQAAGSATEITLHQSLKVRELEQAFLEKAGLPAQVFRKSGNVWIETSLTDDWTLEQQNSEGELLSKPVFVSTIVPKQNEG